MASDSNDTPAASPARSTSRFLLLVAGITGALVGLVLALVVIYVVYGSDLVAVNEALLEANEAKWNEAGIADYELELTVTFREPHVYQITVQNGNVVEAQLNGKPIQRAHARETWTIPGMFATLRVDLERQKNNRKERRDNLVLRGKFDPQWGFPRRVLRIERHEMGTNPEATWEVTRFVAKSKS